jgi:hypothetical protein
MMNDELPFDGPSADPIKQCVEAAQEHAKQLRQQADDATKAAGIWSRLLESRDRGLWFRLRALIDEERVFFHRLRESGDPVVVPLEKLYKEAKEQTEDLLHSLPRDIEKLAERENLALDRSSRHPKYTFKDGFITLQIDEAKRIAKISNYEVKVSEIPADIATIGEVLKSEETRLFSRKFDGARFLQKLRTTYVAILKKEKRPDGDPVPLRTITRKLASNDKVFRRDEFLIDLSKLAMEGPAEVSGYRFELQQTKDANQGMLLYGPAGRGMVNLLIFNKTTP